MHTEQKQGKIGYNMMAHLQAKLVSCQFNPRGHGRLILTVIHVQFCQKPCTPIVSIATFAHRAGSWNVNELYLSHDHVLSHRPLPHSQAFPLQYAYWKLEP